MKSLTLAAEQVFARFSPEALRQRGRAVRLGDGLVALSYPPHGPGAPARLTAGEVAKTQGELLVFRTGRLVVEFRAADMLSTDGHPLTMAGAVAVAVDEHDTEALLDFVRVIVADRVTLALTQLGRALAADIRAGLAKYVANHEAAGLVDADEHPEAESYLRSAMRRLSREASLSYLGLVRGRFAAPTLDADRAREREAVRHKQRRAIALRIARDEALSRHEFANFVASIKHEEALANLDRQEAELSRRQQLDQAYAAYERNQHDLKKTLCELEAERELVVDWKKFEARLAQATRVQQAIQNGSPALMFAAFEQDPKTKERLYREFMSHERYRAAKELTPEQLAALAAPSTGEIEELLERFTDRIAELIERGSHPALRPVTDADLPCSTHRFLVVAGKSVFALNPKASFRELPAPTGTAPGATLPMLPPAERYDFTPYHLGSLRSVHVARLANQDVLLIGARQGVYVFDPTRADEVEERAFFTESVHKGGANAAVIAAGRLWATHSEQGVASWPIDDPTCLSRPHFAEALGNCHTVRGIFAHGERVYFVADSTIYAFDPRDPQDRPAVAYRGSGSEVTSLVVLDEWLYAGNRQGQLLAWALDRPDAPRLEHRQDKPIYMLKRACLGGLPQLVEGAKQYGVTVRHLKSSLFTVYRAPVPIRWVDAGSDFVAGVSSDQRRLFLFGVTEPKQPLATFAPGESIQDIAHWPRAVTS